MVEFPLETFEPVCLRIRFKFSKPAMEAHELPDVLVEKL